jgi:hypothetical protein
MSAGLLAAPYAGGMLTAQKPAIWSRTYTISQDGGQVARWEPHWWRSGGTFHLDGHQYAVRSSAWRNKYALLDPAGKTLATADRVGRKRWAVAADGYSYDFRRASIWRSDQELVRGDQVVGSIHRTSIWRSSAVADLPGLPVPVQAFVLCVVLAMWEADAGAGAVAGAG